MAQRELPTAPEQQIQAWVELAAAEHLLAVSVAELAELLYQAAAVALLVVEKQRYPLTLTAELAGKTVLVSWTELLEDVLIRVLPMVTQAQMAF